MRKNLTATQARRLRYARSASCRNSQRVRKAEAAEIILGASWQAEPLRIEDNPRTNSVSSVRACEIYLKPNHCPPCHVSHASTHASAPM